MNKTRLVLSILQHERFIHSVYLHAKLVQLFRLKKYFQTFEFNFRFNDELWIQIEIAKLLPATIFRRAYSQRVLSKSFYYQKKMKQSNSNFACKTYSNTA